MSAAPVSESSDRAKQEARATRAVKQYAKVQVVGDRFPEDCAPPGTIGTVLDVFHDGSLVVEDARSNGTTIALLVVQRDEVELVERNE